MTTTDYLINAMFVLLVVRQARERELDLRSLLLPVGLLAVVGHAYLRSIPATGNDLFLVGVLAAIGVTLGIISGMATHVRAGDNELAIARVGWLAGGLLVLGISARMAFAFAVTHGAHQSVATFSVVHHISAAAWPVALVAMAICEVTMRIATVQLRGRLVMNSPAAGTTAITARV